MALVSKIGEVLELWSIPTDIRNQGKQIIPDIVQSIFENLDKNNLTTSDILGIGMGSPEQIDYQHGTVCGAYNLGWDEIQEVRDQFEKEFSLPFLIENDANVAALGERWKGAGEDAQDVIFITLGTGVGGGIIARGNLLRGVSGSAGEVGHMPIPGNPFTCTCGNVGCLETVASATGITNIALKLFETNTEPTSLYEFIKTNNVTAKEIFDAAKNGDSFANKIVKTYSNYLGTSLAQLANALNPSYIVIGGGVSAAGEFLLTNVKKEFNRYAFPTVRRSTELKLATLGNVAGVIGAASLLL